jgi:hypothetical protein
MAGSPRYYTIGFVAPERPVVRPLGSGTLVSFGTLHGILTAGHVVDNLQKEKEEDGLKEIGFAQFNIRDAQPQKMLFQTDWIDDVKIGNRPDSEFGPDLAFIRLPDQATAALKVNSSFLNLLQEADLASAPEATKQYDVICGGVFVWTTYEPNPSKLADIGMLSTLMNQGNVIEIAECEGFDRLEFSPLPNQEFVPPLANQQIFPPKSYGGTSGGGLWRMYAETMADGKQRLVRSRLLGVPYFEKKANDLLTIICHGPQSIYRRLPEKIRSRWKNELGVDQ